MIFILTSDTSLDTAIQRTPNNGIILKENFAYACDEWGCQEFYLPDDAKVGDEYEIYGRRGTFKIIIDKYKIIIFKDEFNCYVNLKAHIISQKCDDAISLMYLGNNQFLTKMVIGEFLIA